MVQHENSTDAKPHVLVVEDNALARRALGRMIPDEQYDVTFAVDGESALTTMMMGGIDVVVADVQMPGLSGVEMLRHVRDYDKHMPVIFVTGNTSVAFAAQAVELGAFRYFTKPIRRETIRRALRDAVERCSELAQMNSVAPPSTVAASQGSRAAHFELFESLGPRCSKLAIISNEAELLPIIRLTAASIAECIEEHPAWMNYAVVEMSIADGLLTSTELRGHWDRLRERGVSLAVGDHTGSVDQLAELGTLKPNYVVMHSSVVCGVECGERQQDAIVRILDAGGLVGAKVVVPHLHGRRGLDTLRLLGCRVFELITFNRSCVLG